MSQAVVSYRGYGRYIITHESASVIMDSYSEDSYRPNELYLSCFGSTEREKGHGTEVLNVCRRIARKLNKPLTLTASPYNFDGQKPYDIDRLKSYYQKRGFKVVNDRGYSCDMRYN